MDAAFGEVTKQFQKQANLPGFRKGKAPLDKVQARFSQQIEDEVQKKLLNDSYRKGVEDNNLKPVLDPEVDEVNFKKGEAFSFSPISRPRRSLNYPNKGHPAERPKVEVSDADVEAPLITYAKAEQNIRRRIARRRMAITLTSVSSAPLTANRSRRFPRLRAGCPSRKVCRCT